MNREIKFRAWDKTTKEMVDLTKTALVLSLQGGILVTTDDGDLLFSEKYELMQYTGLKDKNGKEIYEGDVVKNEWNGDARQIEDIREVDWLLSDGFLAGQGVEKDGVEVLEAVEVIGNIYEDGYLLNKDNGEQSKS